MFLKLKNQWPALDDQEIVHNKYNENNKIAKR